MRGSTGGTVWIDTNWHGEDSMEHITSSRPEFTVSRPDFSVLRLSAGEEFVNAVTHGLGLVMAVVGAMVMLAGASIRNDARLAFGSAVYLFTLVAVYAMSTLSHSATSPKWRAL